MFKMDRESVEHSAHLSS